MFSCYGFFFFTIYNRFYESAMHFWECFGGFLITFGQFVQVGIVRITNS
jgi:hypothetical protein